MTLVGKNSGVMEKLFYSDDAIGWPEYHDEGAYK